MNRFLIFGISFAVVAGCARPVNQTSKIVLQAPNSAQMGSMATLPVGQTACYGVSIKGGLLNGGPANSCSPDVGMVAGYAVSGQTLELEVPKGTGYTIDLYLYLMDVGDSGPCPTFSRIFTPNDLNHVYHVGTAGNLNFSKDEEVVTINSFFPGVGSTIASNFSSSCMGSAGLSRNYKIVSGAGLATSATHKLMGRIGRVQDGPILSNGAHKIVTSQ